MKIFAFLLVIISLGVILFPFNPAMATLTDTITDRYENFFLGRPGQEGEGAGYIADDSEGLPIALRIGVLLNAILMLVGMIFLIFVFYSGIQWMFAGGNEEVLKKARARIVRATIGLVIVLGAWVITSFILNAAFGRSVRPPDTGPVRFRTF